MSMQLNIAKDGTLVWYSRGKTDQGKWRIDGDKFCGDMIRSVSTCNELRIGDRKIYYKRVTENEVVTLEQL